MMNAIKVYLIGFLFIFSLALVHGITPVETVQPNYPKDLLNEGMEGKAVIQAVVNKEGIPEECTIVEATEPAFGEAALEAARQWKFKPLEGDVDTRRVNIPFEFKLSWQEKINRNVGRKVFRELNPKRARIDLENIEKEYRPKPVREAIPKYPEDLKGTGTEGKVVITHYVDEEGKTVNPVVEEYTHDQFIMPALMSVIMSEWRPIYSNDEPVYYRVTRVYEFTEGMETAQVGDAEDSPVEKKKKKK